MNPEAVEVLGHQDRVQTEGVQDVEKGVSDKEDNVNVDGQEKFIDVIGLIQFYFLFPCFLRKKGEMIHSDLLFRFVLWIEVSTSLLLFNLAFSYIDRSLVSTEFVFL